MELQPVFQYLFLQRLPQTLRTLLGEQECGDIRALAALADRLWASHKPQPHEVMAVQEPGGGGSSEPQVAAVQPKKKQCGGSVICWNYGCMLYNYGVSLPLSEHVDIFPVRLCLHFH
jgi:hypothetical protein